MVHSAKCIEHGVKRKIKLVLRVFLVFAIRNFFSPFTIHCFLSSIFLFIFFRVKENEPKETAL